MSEETKGNTGEAIEVPQRPGTKIMQSILGGGQLPFATSFVPKTDPERIALVKALTGTVDGIKDSVGQQFQVRHVLFKEVEGVDPESGEVQKYIRTVLITPTGELKACGSRGVLDSLSAIGFAFGPPPWEPAIVVCPKLTTTGSKRSYLQLELIGRAKK